MHETLILIKVRVVPEGYAASWALRGSKLAGMDGNVNCDSMDAVMRHLRAAIEADLADQPECVVIPASPEDIAAALPKEEDPCASE